MPRIEGCSVEQQVNSTKPKKIGLIGGLAFRAGIFYYDQIQQRFAADETTLELVLSHADIRTVLAYVGAGDTVGLGNYLGSMANQLFDAGAELVAVTAVAPHLAIEQIARIARGPVVNVLDAIGAALAPAGIDRIGVFGNRVVMETGVFGAIPDAMIVKPKPPVIDELHGIYTDIALTGKRGSHSETLALAGIARDLIDHGGAQAILLAGTDLSSFYADQPPSYPFLDVARLHIDAILGRAHEA
ncbi:MAG: Asp/Glu racemase [Rhodospirillales bacterium 20-64-7]|nr:MAG: Asp/Glu racemase [Rhodospirillales bacterium 20-64-7]